MRIIEDYPSTFSMNEFNSIKSYKNKVQYANERLQKLANGSGRVVFKIDNTKVLKLAKNKKGLAQNDVETDGYFHMSNMVAEIFEYDKSHEIPYWLEMEFAKKVTPNRFKQLVGISLKDLYNHMFDKSHGSEVSFPYIDDNEWVQELMSVIADMDMPYPGDFGRASTYGEVLRNGKPTIVLVDYGLTSGVWKDHYQRKMRKSINY